MNLRTVRSVARVTAAAFTALLAGWIVLVTVYALQIWADDRTATWSSALTPFRSTNAWVIAVAMIACVIVFVSLLTRPSELWRAGPVRALCATSATSAIGIALAMLVRSLTNQAPFDAPTSIIVAVIAGLGGWLWGIGAFGWWSGFIAGGAPGILDDREPRGARGLASYLRYNVDHKVIGIQYLWTTFTFFTIAGFLAEIMRAELARPGLQFVTARQYNALFSLHGTLMIFLFAIPAFAGVANYMVPLMLGARDMALPRVNALAFWMLAYGGVVMLASVPFHPFDTGWTAYAPLATQAGLGQLFYFLGIEIVGVSSMLGAINFLTTITFLRTQGMTAWRMPLFVWTMVATSLLVLVATPFVAGAQLLSLLDFAVGTSFFHSLLGSGNPLLYQHAFWAYSHPAVYVMVLPGFGIISEVVTSHARRGLYGYRAVVISTMAIALLGLGVWAHHMFASGMAPWLRVPTMATSLLIAIPTGIKVFSWLGTIWNGCIHMTTAMLFALTFLITFTMGGLTGVMVASVPFDLHVTDSYFIVAHLHYVLFGGSVMALFSGMYHWYPKMTGRFLDERLGRWHCLLTFIGTTLTYLPMHWLGTMGMTRRIADYAPKYTTWNEVSSFGAALLGIAFLPFMWNVVRSRTHGVEAGDNPWESTTLEWSTSSPPPVGNFTGGTPVVTEPVYSVHG